MALDPIIECFSRDLVHEYCHGLGSSVVYTAPLIFGESLPGLSNRSLPRLLLHMHAEKIVPAFLTLNIYIGLCLPKALTLSRLQSYKMFEILRLIGIHKSLGLRGHLHLTLLRDAFPSQLARGIHLKEEVS